MFKNILITLSLFILAGSASAENEIGQNLSTYLDGKTIAWQYEGGRDYEIRFEDGMLTYHRTNGDVAREWRSMVPYMAREIREGEYLVGWHEKDISNYVTLLFRLDIKKVYSSAILDDYDLIHFQEAKITGIRDSTPADS